MRLFQKNESVSYLKVHTEQADFVISGTNGWIGGAAVKFLNERGHRVISIDRNSPLDAIKRITRPEQTHFLCLGGKAHLPRNRHERELFAANCDFPETMAIACRDRGLASFTYLSSSKVLGDSSSSGPLSERSPRRPCDAYARSKVAGEDAVIKAMKSSKTRLIIVRPPLVYGEGVGANFRRLITLSKSRWPLPFDAARAPRSMIFNQHLIQSCESLSLGGYEGIFHVSDGVDLSAAEWIALIRKLLGRPNRMVCVPPKLMRGVFFLINQPAWYQALFAPMQLDCSKIQALNIRPWLTPEQALVKVIAAEGL